MTNSAEYPDFKTLLEKTGQYVTVVHGVSMYPMLRDMQDTILIVPVCGELKPYDIAVYCTGDNYTVHRVLEVKPDHYVIRGDNRGNTEYIPKDLVLGRVEGFWRFGKYISASDWRQRAYAHLWVRINPLIRLIHKLHRTLQ